MQDTNDKVIIALTNIGKRYPLIKDINPRPEGFWALRGVSLDVNKGEVLGIIGRNGAGKTTLLNIITGALSATEGSIEVKGKVLGLFNLGVGFQDELSGRENIFLNGAILGATHKEIENKLPDIVAFSELGDFINMPLGSYSQGMRLRLGFSIVANLDCDILIIDEVLAVGDTLFQSKCFERLMDFRRQGKTLVITSQSMELIERLCDKVILLEHGKGIFYGHPADGINRYRALLNTEKFFVGPAEKDLVWFENTKKWVDVSDWDVKLGTKEAVIGSVKLINKFGFACKQIKSKEALRVKVSFAAKNTIKQPHFGVAIFRNDGVYCYGPNTVFDGYNIPSIKPGRGSFVLSYKNVWLAPGDYRLSVALWDRNEALPFDYHNGYYRLTIKGNNKNGALLNMPVDSNNGKIEPDLSVLKGKGNQKSVSSDIAIESVRFFNSSGGSDSFITGEPAKIDISLNKAIIGNQKLFLWTGIFRDDDIYCQGITVKINNGSDFTINYPRLLLLPGGYKLSAGIWDEGAKKFLACHHAVYPLKMIFNWPDHGTVYLDHQWHWKTPV